MLALQVPRLKEPAATDAKRSKKASRKLRWMENRVAVYYLEPNLCQICGDDNDKFDNQEMRSCGACDMSVCNYCLPSDRTLCVRCPELDSLYREDEDLGWRCQKCRWTYYADGRFRERGLQRCVACRLAICEWCCSLQEPRFARKCPAGLPIGVQQRSDAPALSRRRRGVTPVSAMDRLRAAICEETIDGELARFLKRCRCLLISMHPGVRPSLGAYVGGLGPLLGPMLAVLGRSWGQCWRSWGALGGHVGDLGLLLWPMLAVLGRPWGQSSRS